LAVSTDEDKRRDTPTLGLHTQQPQHRLTVQGLQSKDIINFTHTHGAQRVFSQYVIRNRMIRCGKYAARAFCTYA
jgi:hypothetical protein